MQLQFGFALLAMTVLGFFPASLAAQDKKPTESGAQNPESPGVPEIPMLSIPRGVKLDAEQDAKSDHPKVDEEKIAEWTAKIQANPNNADNYKKRGVEYAKGHAWKKAATDFVQFAKTKGGNSYIGQQVGVLVLMAEDQETYKVLCDEMLTGYKETDNVFHLERTAKLCTMTTKPMGDVKKLLTMAEKSLDDAKKFKYAAHHYRTLALVQYRAEKYDDALKTVREGIARDGRAKFKIPAAVTGMQIIEGMCLRQQGKTEDAKTSLSKAKKELDKVFKDETKMFETTIWHGWLFNQMLYKEADELLKKPTK